MTLRALRGLKLLVCLVSQDSVTLHCIDRLTEHYLRIKHLGYGSSLTSWHRRKRHILRDLQVPIQNTLKLSSDVGIARLVLVVQTLQVKEYILHLRNVFRDDPEFLLRIVETVGLNVLDFVHSVLLLFPPLEFLIEKVKDHEVQAPEIISSREILFSNLIRLKDNLQCCYEHLRKQRKQYLWNQPSFSGA